jgi:O-acetyl-ADP-ribose deacetylase
MEIEIVEGDLLEQPTEAIVNSWNRNIIPWWLLLPQGVSGSIKKRAGYQPFKELAKKGAIPLGGAVATSAGKLPYKAIIHVAGISMLWVASSTSIRDSVINAIKLADEMGIKSIAMPLIGAGTGGIDEKATEKIIVDTLKSIDYAIKVIVVRYKKVKDL